jgi:DNA-binding response OmpR family regulator
MEQVSDAVGVLDRARLLVVEDDFIISLELQSVLGAAGAQSVTTCHKVSDALKAVQANGVDAAILDVKLAGETAAPVARELARLGIPFLFYTGQTETDPTRTAWPVAPIIAKPSPSRQIVTALAQLLGR